MQSNMPTVTEVAELFKNYMTEEEKEKLLANTFSKNEFDGMVMRIYPFLKESFPNLPYPKL